MSVGTPASATPAPGNGPKIPRVFLNCYEIVDPSSLRWSVGLYKVRRTDGVNLAHSHRGVVKQSVWDLKKKNPGLCPGYGFVVDVDAETAAVPGNWKLPSGVVEGGHRVTFGEKIETDPENPSHRKVIEGILREAVKKHFKDNQSNTLGALWQDYDRFCQAPAPEGSGDEEFLFCRKFGVTTKVLRGGRWVMQVFVNTVTVDKRTFGAYYLNGDVSKLAAMIEAKRAKRTNRQNRPVATRVLRDQSAPSRIVVAALELSDPGSIETHGRLSRQDQSRLAGGNVSCQAFGQSPTQVPMSQVRLILDTQLTGGDHTETIIEPEERCRLARHVRDFLHGLHAYGRMIPLAESPTDASTLPTRFIPPPALRVKDRDRGESLIPACTRVDEVSLQNRGRRRTEHIRRNGFLHQRPINPLIAWPERFGLARAQRMRDDLNQILRSEGIEFSFKEFLYRDAEQLNSYIQQERFDTLLAVLPEGGQAPYRDGDMHESIKQRIRVPSQCIHHDHTLPPSLVDRTQQEFNDSQRKLAVRIRQRYELCLWNLLVKHHWVPFAPNDPFRFNVHIGLDVGGRHNNHAMACLGYGFATPREGIFLRPEEIPIDTQKAEPIPTDSLYRVVYEDG